MEYSKRITDERFIINLFRNLFRLKRIPVVADHVMADMLIKDRRGNEIVLENYGRNQLSVDTSISIGFFYNETFYSFTSLKTMKDSVYYLEKPPEIYAAYKRQLNRYIVKDIDNILLKIAGKDNVFKVKDISIKGLSFESDVGYEVGTIINNIEIILDGSQTIFLDGAIKYRNANDSGSTYGLAFTDIDWFSIRTLFLYIFKNSYPNIKSLAEFDKESIRKLFEAYLVKLPESIGKKRFEDMIVTMNHIKSNQEISASLVYVKDDNLLLSTASALRIYNRTFLGHQLVAIPQSATNIRSRADIYYSLADYALNNKYFDYYISYYVTLLSWHDLMFQSIENYISEKNKVLINKIQFFAYSTECNFKYEQKDYQVEVLNDPEVFLEFCNNHLEPIEVKAYSYESDFYLEEIKQVYEALGLYISRKLWCVKRNRTIVAYIVGESSSNGLNLFNLMDMVRFIFVDTDEKDKESIIKASLEQISKYYQRYKKDSFNLVLQGENNDINIEGLIPNQSWARVIMNKEGGIEYKKLIKLLL
ncbi:MAG: PilZ domain-containing protein [Bacillota bacterium]